MLYLWLLEITKVRIRFQNDFLKADKRISHHHLGITGYFLLTKLKYYCENKCIVAALWLREITQGRIRFQNYLQADKRIRHIQNLYAGYNLENSFVE